LAKVASFQAAKIRPWLRLVKCSSTLIRPWAINPSISPRTSKVTAPTRRAIALMASATASVPSAEPATTPRPANPVRIIRKLGPTTAPATMTRAAPSWPPAMRPSDQASASGFWNRVCIIRPASPRAAPPRMAARTRGRRRSTTMRLSIDPDPIDPSPANTSLGLSMT